MSTLRVRLPDSLHKRLADLAKREDISINQLITTAVAEKMAALDTAELLTARAARRSRSKFLAALAKVPDVAPDVKDELPAPARARPRSKRRVKKAG
jgi:hypothetical protein